MINSIGLNSNNDIFLNSQKNLSMVTDIDAVLQNCETYMKTLLGEMVLSIDNGVPFFETVWNNLDLVQFEGYARERLLQVNGVVQILSFTATTNNNVLSYTVTIQTIYGVGSINE